MDASNTSAAPSLNPPPGRPLSGLLELVFFIASAAGLFFLVQFIALSFLVYGAYRQNPETALPRLTRQVVERVQYNAFFAVPLQVVYYALLLLLLYALVRSRGGQPFWSSLAVHPLARANWLRALAAGMALAVLIQLANVIAPPPENIPFDRLFSSRAAAWLIMAASLLVAPFVEELVFRGYIYSLLEHIWGTKSAVVISGVLFGVIHLTQLYPAYFQVGLLCLVGIVFSLARARTGTVLASMLLHFGYNATLSLLFVISPQFRSLPACF